MIETVMIKVRFFDTSGDEFTNWMEYDEEYMILIIIWTPNSYV